MKKLLLLTLVCGLVAAGAVIVFSPVEVEEYGQAVVQFDEKNGTYFVDVVCRYEVEPTRETKVGMPVSYLKNKGVDYRISSKLQTKEEMVRSAEEDICSGAIFSVLIFWGVGALVLLGEYLGRKRRGSK